MSKKIYLLGVDLGTSSTKAALYHIDGTLVAQASIDVPILYPQPGAVEQDLDTIYASACAAIRTVIQTSGINARAIAAVAFDSQMAGIGSIRDDFTPASPFDSWLDTRCKPFIDQLDLHHGERITQLTGCPPTCNHGPKIMWAQHYQRDHYADTAKFVMPSCYVAGKLAGLTAADAFIDYTFLHFTTLADARKGTWSQELIDIVGVDRDKLPRIVEPWAVIGEVTDDAAKHTGLASGTPIAAGCGDTAAGALGAGIVAPGMVFDVAGTASVLSVSTDTFVADVHHRALITMRSVIPGLWNPLAYIAGGGQAVAWFRNEFFNVFQGKHHGIDSDLFLEITQLAEQALPGADDLYFSPHLSGRVCPAAPDMRGAWIGFTWSHTQAHFARAILESIGYEYAYYLSILRATVPDITFKETRVIGGGARSPLWNQIKADILDIPYQTLNRSEYGTWGAAMIAGKAAHVYDDLTEIAHRHAQPVGAPIMPNADRVAQYQPRARHYQQLQQALVNAFRSQNTASMTNPMTARDT